MNKDQFLNNYSKIAYGKSTQEDVEQTKEYLSSLTEVEKKALTNSFKISSETIARVEDVELFELLLDVFVEWDYALTGVLRGLMKTANREEHYRIVREMIDDYMVDSKFYADLIGSDLDSLRLQALVQLASGKQEVKVYIGNYSRLTNVLEHGFIPSFDLYDSEALQIILEHPDLELETLEYFYNIHSLPKEFHMFVMLTEEAAKELHKKHSDTTAMLRWTYPHLLYSSQRIRTDMSMFRTPFSNTGLVINQTLKTDFGPYTILAPEKGPPAEITGKYCLPVVRYASSLTAGFYHNEPEKTYCGTFYYHEPEASTFLLGDTILVAETKYSAVKYLLEQYKISKELAKEARKAMEDYFTSIYGSLNKDWEENKFQPNLLYTAKELDDKNLSWNVSDYRDSDKVTRVPFYSGKIIDLYAKEDPFDQPLCLLAKEAKIDLVVLTRMVGAKQIVTEVLDARSREESFKNLVFI